MPEQTPKHNGPALTGQLVSAIAHQLKQPLTAIKGFAQAALQDLDENSPVRKDLEMIIEQADRIDKIIKDARCQDCPPVHR